MWGLWEALKNLFILIYSLIGAKLLCSVVLVSAMIIDLSPPLAGVGGRAFTEKRHNQNKEIIDGCSFKPSWLLGISCP